MIDLLELGAEVRPVDPVARPAADRLGQLADWLAATAGGQLPGRFKRVRLVAAPPVRAAVSEAAATADVGVRELTSGADAAAGYAAGIAAADGEIDAGSDLLLLAVPDEAPAAALVVGLLTGAEPVALLPRGAAATDSAGWIADAIRLRDSRRALASLRHSPGELLTAVDSPVLAAATAFTLRAAARRTPLVLDGTGALAAALLCAEVQPRAAQWWQVSDTSVDPVHARAVQHLGQTPVLQLDAGRGDGTAALLTVAVLRSAVTVGGFDD